MDVLWSGNLAPPDNGKPTARWGRKATGLSSGSRATEGEPLNTNVASLRSAYTSQSANAGSKASSQAPRSPFGAGTSVRISQEAFAKSRAGEATPNPQKRPVGFDDTGNLTRARAAAAYPNPQKAPVSFDDTGNLTRSVSVDDMGKLTRDGDRSERASLGASGSDPGVVGWDVGPVGSDPDPIGFDPGPIGLDPGPIGLDPGPIGLDPGPIGFDPGPIGFDDTGNLTRSVSFDDTGNLT